MKKKRAKNYMIFRRPRSKALKSLNNIYVIGRLTSGWIVELKDKIKKLDTRKIHFEYPTQNGKSLKVARKKSKIIRLLDEKSRYDIYKESIISSVTIFEQYLSQMLSVIYRIFPQKLKTNIKGEEIEKNININLLFEHESISELIDYIIERQIISIIQCGPEKYFNLIGNVFSIQVRELPIDEFIEIKATRDLIVHNNGIVNATYIKKAA